jgi:hypothetical protein
MTWQILLLVMKEARAGSSTSGLAAAGAEDDRATGPSSAAHADATVVKPSAAVALMSWPSIWAAIGELCAALAQASILGRFLWMLARRNVGSAQSQARLALMGLPTDTPGPQLRAKHLGTPSQVQARERYSFHVAADSSVNLQGLRRSCNVAHFCAKVRGGRGHEPPVWFCPAPASDVNGSGHLQEAASEHARLAAAEYVHADRQLQAVGACCWAPVSRWNQVLATVFEYMCL